MTKTIHMGQSIKGPLLNWSAKDWKRALKYMTRDDGLAFGSVQELKEAFLAELAQGHEVIPLGVCDNWDWKKGCGGHPIPE